LHQKGYFEFEPNVDLLTEEQVSAIQSFYFATNGRMKKTPLVSGAGSRFVCFRNCANSIMGKINYGSKELRASFLDALTAIYSDFVSRFGFESGMLKIGAVEFLSYVNATDELLYGQITHLDAFEGAENRFGLFVPVQFSLAQSDLKIIPNREYSIAPVGTRVVDLEKCGSKFSFSDVPLLKRDCWLVDAPILSLRNSPSTYTAIVVNKIPHGGGAQVPFSQRITMFVYLVPMNWDAKSLWELENTIPAIQFLLPQKGDFCPIDELERDPDVKSWLKRVRGIPEHFLGNVEYQHKVLQNAKNVYSTLKDLCEKINDETDDSDTESF
jgi:hypothetical protein